MMWFDDGNLPAGFPNIYTTNSLCLWGQGFVGDSFGGSKIGNHVCSLYPIRSSYQGNAWRRLETTRAIVKIDATNRAGQSLG